jgi:hypothetical protein
VVLNIVHCSCLRSTDFVNGADWTDMLLTNEIGPPKPLTLPSAIDGFGGDFGPVFGLSLANLLTGSAGCPRLLSQLNHIDPETLCKLLSVLLLLPGPFASCP